MKDRLHTSQTALHAPVRRGLLQRKCACGGTPGLTGECAECRRKRRVDLQTKLTVNRPGDRYEQEADRVADQVMRMPAPVGVLQREPLVGPITPLMQRQPIPEEEEEPLQTNQAPGSMPSLRPGVASEIAAMRSGGQPLPSSERAFMEPRFGFDFSRVQIHADGRAAAAARSVQARAFTVGQDVVFGSGEYRPGMLAGRRLLAHELTHVVQQQTTAPAAIQREPNEGKKEEEAWEEDYYYKTEEEAQRRVEQLKNKDEWREYRIRKIKIKGETHWQVDKRGRKAPPKEEASKKDEEVPKDETKKADTPKDAEAPKDEGKKADTPKKTPKTSKNICLTFDDGPQKGSEEVLDVLGGTIPATFFLTGNNMDSNPKEQKRIVERMLNEGHKIGNHTYTHSPMRTSDYTKMYGDLSDPARLKKFNENFKKNEDHFRKLLGKSHPVFKLARLPGSGRFVKVGGKLIYVAQTEALGMKHITWHFEFAPNGTFPHVKEKDWQGVKGVAAEVARLPGSNNIVLYHDRHWKGTNKALFQALIDKLKAESFTFGQLTDQGKCAAKAAPKQASTSKPAGESETEAESGSKNEAESTPETPKKQGSQ